MAASAPDRHPPQPALSHGVCGWPDPVARPGRHSHRGRVRRRRPPPPVDPRCAGYQAGDPVASDPHGTARHGECGDGCGVAPLLPAAADRRDWHVHRRHMAGPVLDPDEVEMYQAGPVAYQLYHAMRAIWGEPPSPQTAGFCSAAGTPSPTASPTSIRRCGCYTRCPADNAYSPSTRPTPRPQPPNAAAAQPQSYRRSARRRSS
jgi:hypothetical protein